MTPIRRWLLQILRVSFTLIFVALAAAAGWRLWVYYQLEPWTRDGRIRADTVRVAPDVAGLVTNIYVTNDQPVTRGQLLFTIDQERYKMALEQSNATLMAARATLAQARREAARDARLGDLVSTESTEQSDTKVRMDEAAVMQAEAAHDLAKLNLARTEVHAPVDGSLTDMSLRLGDYVAVGSPVMALLDSSSLRVEGYFEETKLPRLKIGAPVRIHLMGEKHDFKGHIQSISPGIEDRDRMASSNLLPNVNPTYNWVRLAQRIPVRIAIDEVPPNIRLVVGRTASVTVIGPDGVSPGVMTGGVLP